MKALFITTQTVDCENHVRAWDSFSPVKAVHATFRLTGVRNDWQAVEAAQAAKPDVIFYIGANAGPAVPRPATFRDLRKVAPLINLCSDAGDRPWHKVLTRYQAEGCFDLQVALDGAREAPVDLATLTPVDPGAFRDIGVPRDIRCGFSGTVGRWNTRSEVVNALEWLGGLTVRRREASDGYENHGRFLRRCRLLLNTSWTGTGQAHHIKGRALEAGWAGCALLELGGSPIADWFPPDCYITWRDPKHAAEIIARLGDREIDAAAAALSAHVREHYTAAKIYGAMLERVGLNVGPAESRPAA